MLPKPSLPQRTAPAIAWRDGCATRDDGPGEHRLDALPPQREPIQNLRRHPQHFPLGFSRGGQQNRQLGGGVGHDNLSGKTRIHRLPIGKAPGRINPRIFVRQVAVTTLNSHIMENGNLAMAKGTVKWFNEKKGFGFIVDPSVGTDIFVHFSAIQSEGFKTLQEGDQVEYELYTDEKGSKARNVSRIAA